MRNRNRDRHRSRAVARVVSRLEQNELLYQRLMRSFTYFLPVLLTLLLFAFTATQARAMNIQQVTSPGGIKAWLVEEPSIPLIAMRFAFRGGSTQDPDGKEGLAHLITTMMDEGAGDMDAEAFQERQEELAMRMSFNASRDFLTGSFQTLADRKDDAAEMLRLALTETRFDLDSFARMTQQIKTGLKFEARDPNKVAGKKWFATAFAGHPYARPVKGSVETLSAITREDLIAYRDSVMAKEHLAVGVVGAISADELGKLLDKVFGGLPEKAKLKVVPDAKTPTGPVRDVTKMPVPQSVAVFGHDGPKRADKDFIPAYVLNYIIGGGGFNSRLMEEVREKRGLAYSVYSYLNPMEQAGTYLGGVATRNEDIGQSLEVIRSVFADIAKNGPTQKELDGAKQYLTGSYPLRFDTSSKIASQLLWIQIEDLGIDYVEKRNELVKAVTFDDIKRVAAELLKPGKMIVTIVGNPVEAPVKTKTGG